MKKRRVLALLLALSLAVSTNGMTVFAAEAGELTAPVTSPLEEAAEDVQDGAEETDTTEDDTDDEQDIYAGDTENTEKNDESDGDSAEDQAGQNGDGTSSGEDADAGGENDADGQNPDAENVSDEAVSENDLPEAEEPEEQEPEEAEELPKTSANEVRMMTFTDDTGLKITYDANAAKNYKYTVTDGVLTKVEEADGTDEEGNPRWKDVTFAGNVELTQPEEGAQYTSVSSALFSGNTDITYLKLPSGVTGIADNAFKGCTALKGVYLPATVTSIGVSAFEGCTAMTQIAVPKEVISIGNSAFKGDTKLYMMYMRDVDYSALGSIGDSAFEGCSALAEFCSDTEFFIPTSLKSIGVDAFRECKSIKKLDLDTAQLEGIGANVFRDCTGLTDVVICRTLGEIPTSAFEGCQNLVSLVFSSQKGVTIGTRAFWGCYGLRQVVLPETIDKVSDQAFASCKNLNRVAVESTRTEIGQNAPFPAGETNGTLYIVGRKYANQANGQYSTIWDYFRQLGATQKEKTRFIETDVANNDGYYKYTVVDTRGEVCADGKIPGGKIWIGTAQENHDNKNINTLNNGKGVQSSNTKYYIYHQADKDYKLVQGSIRSNGEVVQKDKVGYWITMPLGGTVITAEFRRTDSSDRIVGLEGDVVVEFSNGEPIEPGGVDYGVELKVGQTTRMFLIDKSGIPIASSQIKKITSDQPGIAKVSDTGFITAVKKGMAEIQVDLVSDSNTEFSITRRIRVVDADVASISLVAACGDPLVDIKGEDKHGIQTAVVPKTIVSESGLNITLKANAYTAEREGVAKALTWKSSDSRVATVKKVSTTSADSSNVVQIKQGCEGEATITVTAKVDSDSKKTVTQKFVVSVQNKTVKLASTTVVVNPNLKKHGELDIISSYGGEWFTGIPKIYKKAGEKYTASDFQLKEMQTGQIGTEKSRRYEIVLLNSELKNGNYKLYVCLGDAQSVYLPLTITVKRSVPAPTVKFNTKKTKINLFYKNGGTDKDGNPVTVTTEVTKLDKVRIRKFELCALTNKPDDQKFLENFEITEQDLEKGMVVIGKKNQNLKYTEGKNPKAVVAGYLKIYYEGYVDEAAKRVKVTMPTVTTAPAYVLERTSATYRNSAPLQQETLRLLDKKTKNPITLSANFDLKCNSVNAVVRDAKLQDGAITFKVDGSPTQDTATFILRNEAEWDTNKGEDRELSYKFTVKVTDKDPVITTDQTVTLNLNYPEAEGTFGLKSNQKDTVINSQQDFEANKTGKNLLQYDKLEVSYENGEGTVRIKPGAEDLVPGTYKWTCKKPKIMQGMSSQELDKAATLTVKVVDTKPTVKLGKGSLVLNLLTAIEANGAKSYGEKTEIPLKITGKSEGYALNTEVNAGEESTKILCTTESDAEDKFVWTLEDASVDEEGKPADGKLSVSIKDGASPRPKTYQFTMTARYVQQSTENGTPNVVDAKPMTFTVKVIEKSDIAVTLSAKGKLNLVDRESEYTTKNARIFTPSLKNVRGEITDAWIYDTDTDEESRYFDITLNPKDGKLYVTPKKTPINGDAVQGYDYAVLENNKLYRVRIEVKVEGVNHRGKHNGIVSTPIDITTAQALPKVKTDKSTLDVFLSNRQYDATFTVTPQAGAAGTIEEIGFQEKDEVPRDAFDVQYEKQSDGSLRVTVHLKQAVAYKYGFTNKVKMYVKFKGQGTNSAGTLVNMNIRVNK